MVADFGDTGVTGNYRSAAARLALLGAAALLIALGGCGRKAGLDLPPTASAPPPQPGTHCAGAAARRPIRSACSIPTRRTTSRRLLPAAGNGSSSIRSLTSSGFSSH